MDVSGVVSRPLKRSFGIGFGPSADTGKQCSGEFRLPSTQNSKLSLRPRNIFGFLSSGFSDNGHLQYYISPRSGDKKEKSLKTVTIKKKLKLIKGLSKNLSMFSELGFERIGDGHGRNDKGKMISEATEVLLAQLQQLKEEEKAIKRKRKEEKAKLKAARMKARDDSESSSSSSSESSDSDCREVIDMSRLRSEALSKPKVIEPQAPIQAEASLTSSSLLTKAQKTVEQIEDLRILNYGEKNCSSSDGGSGRSIMASASEEKIEVCLGGKCKKLGATALLEEFERKVGVVGAVVGCKCMGKCRNGPNVRVSNSCDRNHKGDDDGFVKPQTNPLFIGVGLEDVGAIVANFFDDKKKNLGLMAA